MSVKLSRKAYAKKYGPTVGDRIRLADSELIIEVEQDYTDYGEESIFGGGKSVRDGQNQCSAEEPMSPARCAMTSSAIRPASRPTRVGSRTTLPWKRLGLRG